MIPAVAKNIPFYLKRKILGTLLLFRRKIDFAIIGFPKCATTSIAKNLHDVPGIFLPSYEVQLRDFIFGKIDMNNSSNRFGIKNPNLIYEQHNLIALIDRNPQIHMILCLRRPTDWLFSFYQYRKLHIENNEAWIRPYIQANPKLSETSFDDIIYKGESLVGASLMRGIFSDYIKFLLKCLPPSRILIVFLEEISTCPATAYEKIFTFLNFDPAFAPTVPVKANQNRSLYESETQYTDHLKYLDKFYEQTNKELNQLLLDNWGIKNTYW